MKKILITNEIFSKFAHLSEDFNLIFFFYLYKNINPSFNFDIQNDKSKYFHKENNTFIFKNLPDISINNSEDLFNFFNKLSISEQKVFSQIFETDYNLDLFKEIEEIFIKKVEDNTISKNFIVSFLGNSLNDLNLIQKHNNIIKSFLTSKTSESNPNFYIEILSKIIDQKDFFGNDFIIERLNHFFTEIFVENNKQSGSFHYNLNLISKKIIFLDTSKTKLNQKLEKFIKNLIPLKNLINDNCFFWEINTAYFSYVNKNTESILKNNVITSLNRIKEIIEDELGILSLNVNINKSSLSISVIHKNEELNNALEKSLEYVLNSSLTNDIVSSETLENILLNFLIIRKNLKQSLKTKI